MSPNDDAILKNWLAAHGIDPEVQQDVVAALEKNLSPIELATTVQRIASEEAQLTAAQTIQCGSSKPEPQKNGVNPDAKGRLSQSAVTTTKMKEYGKGIVVKEGSEEMTGNPATSVIFELFEPPKTKKVSAHKVTPLASLAITYQTAQYAPDEFGVLRGPNWREEENKLKGPSL